MRTIILTLLLAASVFSQSFYNRIGYGQFINQPSAYAGSIGYATTAYHDSLRVLSDNPASWQGLRRVMFTMNTTANLITVTPPDGSTASSRDDEGFRYAQLALPVGDAVGLSAGLSPITFMSGQLVAQTVLGSIIETQSGGVWRYYLGAGWAIKDNFSVGARIDFLNGSHSLNSVITYDSSSVTGTASDETEISGGFRGRTLGLGSQIQATPALRLGFSIDLPLEKPVYTGSLSLNGTETELDYEEELSDWPVAIAAGIHFQYRERLAILAGVSQQVFKDDAFQTGTLFASPEGWSSSSIGSIHLGLVRAPYDRFSRRLGERTEWRLGFTSRNFYLTPVSEQLIKEYFGALGFSFALPESRSFLDMGIELGTRNGVGDFPDELITRIRVGIEWNEMWFRQAKRR